MCRPQLSAARRPHRDDGSPLLVPALIAARLLRSSSGRAHRQANPAQGRAALQRRLQHPPPATAARSNRARFGTGHRTSGLFSRPTSWHRSPRNQVNSTPVPRERVRVSAGVSSACGGHPPPPTHLNRPASTHKRKPLPIGRQILQRVWVGVITAEQQTLPRCRNTQRHGRSGPLRRQG